MIRGGLIVPFLTLLPRRLSVNFLTLVIWIAGTWMGHTLLGIPWRHDTIDMNQSSGTFLPWSSMVPTHRAGADPVDSHTARIQDEVPAVLCEVQGPKHPRSNVGRRRLHQGTPGVVGCLLDGQAARYQYLTLRRGGCHVHN